MSLEEAVERMEGPDLWFCANQAPHFWDYRGKNKGYRCRQCGIACTKEALKRATDA